MSPTTKKIRAKQQTTKAGKAAAKRKPAAGREAPSADEAAEIEVDGVRLPNRLPYLVGVKTPKVAVAQAVIDLRLELSALAGTELEEACGATTLAKKTPAAELADLWMEALDALVAERLRIKAADEAEAAQAAVEQAPPVAKKARAPKAPKAEVVPAVEGAAAPVAAPASTKAPARPMPPVGTKLTKKRDELTVECEVVEGGVLFDGTVYKSLSAAAVAAAAKLRLCTKAQNGFTFWGLDEKTPRTPRAPRAPKAAQATLIEAAARVILVLVRSGHQVNSNTPEVAVLAAALGEVPETLPPCDDKLETVVQAPPGELEKVELFPACERHEFVMEDEGVVACQVCGQLRPTLGPALVEADFGNGPEVVPVEHAELERRERDAAIDRAEPGPQRLMDRFRLGGAPRASDSRPETFHSDADAGL